ncbi:PREDICTED: uncharacterized protein LOC109211337 [Nicotiana attenuata]|uniref:Protein TILLER ANGLE CONTROL 1 n=1 Tax=Nicotiana attenuata TaxID=49451 RepID=A0A314KL50_NICAT|nr:PREDICTED: uncharacterized protein LOC109211337 [Nicotiana attenuata]OIT29449.1 hypothetical protein A4A49_29807 [Nicotiana attenuata]
MKIFSWVHRKYNQKDGLLDRNVKKNELTISNEIIGDTQLLLQDASMEHMLDGWKGGILTIGTFGFGPLKDQRDQLDIEVNEDEECEITVSDDEKDEQLIINPLMYANGHEQSHHEALKANKSEEEGRKKHQIKKERITLADLFSADFDKENIPRANNINPGDKLQPDLFMTTNKASNSQVKNGLSFAKKLMPQVREDSYPILKLQQLMTRVLKRKVHPDMESKNHKTSRVIAAATMLEYISLLKIQETIA